MNSKQRRQVRRDAVTAAFPGATLDDAKDAGKRAGRSGYYGPWAELFNETFMEESRKLTLDAEEEHERQTSEQADIDDAVNRAVTVLERSDNFTAEQIEDLRDAFKELITEYV